MSKLDQKLCRKLAATLAAEADFGRALFPEMCRSAAAQLTAAADMAARFAEVERERDEALGDGVLSQRVCDIENDRAQLRSELEAARADLAGRKMLTADQVREVVREIAREELCEFDSIAGHYLDLASDTIADRVAKKLTDHGDARPERTGGGK